MSNVNDLISLVPVTMHRASYKGKNRWLRNRTQAIAWIAKQIMLAEIYPAGQVADDDRFQDWDWVKKNTIRILKEEGTEAAEVYVRNYVENDYCPTGNE